MRMGRSRHFSRDSGAMSDSYSYDSYGCVTHLKQCGTGAQSEEIKVFAGRFSTSVARQIFHQLFRSTARFWGFHRRPAGSWAGNPGIRRHNRFATSETNAVDALESCQRDPDFICGEAQKNRWTYRTSAGFSPLQAAGQTLKIAIFSGLPG